MFGCIVSKQIIECASHTAHCLLRLAILLLNGERIPREYLRDGCSRPSKRSGRQLRAKVGGHLLGAFKRLPDILSRACVDEDLAIRHGFKCSSIGLAATCTPSFLSDWSAAASYHKRTRCPICDRLAANAASTGVGLEKPHSAASTGGGADNRSIELDVPAVTHVADQRMEAGTPVKFF